MASIQDVSGILILGDMAQRTEAGQLQNVEALLYLNGALMA